MQWSMHCIFPNFESALCQFVTGDIGGIPSCAWMTDIGGISVIQGALKEEVYQAYSLRENKRSLRAINLELA